MKKHISPTYFTDTCWWCVWAIHDLCHACPRSHTPTMYILTLLRSLMPTPHTKYTNTQTATQIKSYLLTQAGTNHNQSSMNRLGTTCQLNAWPSSTRTRPINKNYKPTNYRSTSWNNYISTWRMPQLNMHQYSNSAHMSTHHANARQCQTAIYIYKHTDKTSRWKVTHSSNMTFVHPIWQPLFYPSCVRDWVTALVADVNCACGCTWHPNCACCCRRVPHCPSSVTSVCSE